MSIWGSIKHDCGLSKYHVPLRYTHPSIGSVGAIFCKSKIKCDRHLMLDGESHTLY